jgi:SAM-dependent methyltransferase
VTDRVSHGVRVVPSGPPGWDRLWWHSLRIGGRWLFRGFVDGWKFAGRGLNRLVCPLDPWRFYEMGTVAEERFDGRNLDISSPKLLTSLLQYERQGEWIGLDLFHEEIAGWKYLDPSLRLLVCDATSLPYADGAFHNCISISVVEHIPDSGDTLAVEEMWRVLRPGGVLHLTVPVERSGCEVFIGEEVWGKASKRIGGKVFWERRYSEAQLAERLVTRPWEVMRREFGRQIDLTPERRTYSWLPWSAIYGLTLRWSCPHNFEIGDSIAILAEGEKGAAYLKLRKPAVQRNAAER